VKALIFPPGSTASPTHLPRGPVPQKIFPFVAFDSIASAFLRFAYRPFSSSLFSSFWVVCELRHLFRSSRPPALSTFLLCFFFVFLRLERASVVFSFPPRNRCRRSASLTPQPAFWGGELTVDNTSFFLTPPSFELNHLSFSPVAPATPPTLRVPFPHACGKGCLEFRKKNGFF